MKITRTINGQEITIELTAKEMRETYYEIEKDYYLEDIKTWLGNNEIEVDDDFKDKKNLDKESDTASHTIFYLSLFQG